MTEFLGVVCARSGSKRLPNKNSLEVNGKTLADNAAYTLLKAGIMDTYISTDKPELFKYKNTIKRPDSLSDDKTPLQEAILWTLKLASLVDDYLWTVALMPSAPDITYLDVRMGMNMAKSGKYNIIRSYSPTGEENGLYIINNKIWEESWKYDVFTGALWCSGKEIHTNEDYLELLGRVGI